MTEEEWLAGSSPMGMFWYMQGESSEPSLVGEAYENARHEAPMRRGGLRKHRLLVCAYCRRIETLFDDDRSLRAIEVMERYVDGLADDEELAQAVTSAYEAIDAVNSSAFAHVDEPPWGPVTPSLEGVPQTVAAEAAWLTARGVIDSAFLRVWNAAIEVGTDQGNSQWADQTAGASVQAALLMDIFGNPFRPVQVDPAWLTNNGGIVPQIAQAIYDDRAFDRLPILADALEDAGCTDAEILNHCRGSGVHVRGCWVVDLLSGKS